MYVCTYVCISVLAGISGSLQNRLQLVLNAAARLVCLARKSEHITPLLRELHWFRVPEHIQFGLCVLAYRCVHGTAPAYLSDSLQLNADVRAPCTSSSALYQHHDAAILSSTRRSFLGDQEFPVVAARAWNSLPPATRTANSLLQFRRETKAHLFRLSFSDWSQAIAAFHKLLIVWHCSVEHTFCVNSVKCPCNVRDVTMSL